MWKALSSVLNPKILVPRVEAMVYDFRDPATLTKWQATSDKFVGGFSTASLQQLPDGSGTRFSGTISTKTGPKMERSGYAAARSRLLPTKYKMLEQFHDLDDFDELQFCVRGDGRTYFLTIQTDGLVPEDIYQSFLYTKKSEEYSVVKVPINDFILTNHGIVLHDQLAMNRSAIKTIGVVINDLKEGDYALDLQYIKAVNNNPIHLGKQL